LADVVVTHLPCCFRTNTASPLPAESILSQWSRKPSGRPGDHVQR
jgi:hypothetical protein